jgi:hypothetical protein
MQPQDLSDELLTLIHNGAAPLDAIIGPITTTSPCGWTRARC